MWQLVLIREALAVAAAASGAFLAVSSRRISHFTLCVLISFAAGALLGVTLFDIVPESLEHSGRMLGGASIVVGYTVFYILNRFISHICPACAATHTEVDFKALTIAMVVALTIHSFMDGLAIVSGHTATQGTAVTIFWAVASHKFPEGIALALVARGSGMSRKNAFLLTVGLEAVTTLAGGVVGIWAILPHIGLWSGLVLGFVGGGFVFLVIHALLSEVIKHHPRSTVFSAISGFMVMAILTVSVH